jgi:DNA-binding response OmpR family regulator
MKIFIVDDNADYRHLLGELLRDKGWEAVEVPDGEACLRLLHDHVPDVILSDVMMPHVDGFQLLRTLRGDPAQRDVLFIFYTSTYEKTEHRDFALSLGADAYIVKPLDPDEILAALTAVMTARGAGGSMPVLSEEEFLRKHNVLLSEKLLEKTRELQQEAEDHRRDEEELLSLRHRTGRPGGTAALSVSLAPVQCPFTVSENVYRPITEIDTICDQLSARKGELDNIGASTIIDQLCSSMKRLRQHVRDLQNYIIIPRSELYAPMRRIQMLIEVLKQDYPSLPGWIYFKIGQIEGHLRHFATLVEDLVKLTSVAKAEVTPQQVDMSMLARALIEDLRKSTPKRPAEIVIKEGMLVNGDRRLLRMVLEQLLDNAWKFSMHVPVARIQFDFSDVEQKRIYFVRDNGAGFDMKEAGNLFVAFHKLHPIEQFPGNGIGLAIVKAAVCRHGGTVWATGEPEKGATLFFTVPQ